MCLEKADLPSCTWYLEQLKAVSLNFMPRWWQLPNNHDL